MLIWSPGTSGASAARDPCCRERRARGDVSDFEARRGRPGIAPERLLRALLLQCFYSVRSERQLMERLEFDLLFRWFVGLGVDDQVWDASVFSKNRDRMLAGEVAQRFLAELLASVAEWVPARICVLFDRQQDCAI